MNPPKKTNQPVENLRVPSFIIPICSTYCIVLKNPRVGWKILNRFLSNGSAVVLLRTFTIFWEYLKGLGMAIPRVHEESLNSLHVDSILLEARSNSSASEN